MVNHKLRLIALVSGLLLLAFMATSLASFYVSRDSLRRQILAHELPLTSDNVYSEIQHDIVQTVLISSFMANDTFLRDWVVDGEKDPAKIQQYLQTIQEKYHTVSAFFVSEATRNYYCASGVLKKVRPDEPRDAWYFRVREMKAPYETNFDPDLANNDRMTVFVNYRVLDEQGRYIGTTGVGLAMDVIERLIHRYEQAYGCHIYFLNRAGKVVLHGFEEDVQAADVRTFRDLSADERARLLAGDSVTDETADGETVFLDGRPIPEMGWHLVAERLETGVVAAITHTLLVNLAISLVATLAVIVLLHFLYKSHQRRLLREHEELEEARHEIDRLNNLLPICSICRRIRDENGVWHAPEEVLARTSDSSLTHGLCPDCIQKHYGHLDLPELNPPD